MFDLYLKTANKELMDNLLQEVADLWNKNNPTTSFQEQASIYEMGYLQKEVGTFDDPEQGTIPVYEDWVEKGWLVNLRTLQPVIAQAVQQYIVNPSTPESTWASQET